MWTRRTDLPDTLLTDNSYTQVGVAVYMREDVLIVGGEKSRYLLILDRNYYEKSQLISWLFL